jgi:tRNA pseudouridine38-40 synthase
VREQRFKALLAYDGTTYFGFQRQLRAPTIQSEVEDVLSAIAREPIHITGAGRTDSGVHATGQVISFNLSWRHGVAQLQRAINVNLPQTIVVRDVQIVDDNFHPRFDAKRRTYEYTIYNAEIRNPLQRLTSWHISKPLDWVRMNQAATCLIGTHDFATFGRPPQGDVTVRHVFRADWRQQGHFLTFTIEANAYLYRMVRSIVGTLKAVGDGSLNVEQFTEAFALADRQFAGTTAPAHGLVLSAVDYESDS